MNIVCLPPLMRLCGLGNKSLLSPPYTMCSRPDTRPDIDISHAGGSEEMKERVTKGRMEERRTRREMEDIVIDLPSLVVSGIPASPT